jgi:hypothetical protein
MRRARDPSFVNAAFLCVLLLYSQILPTSRAAVPSGEDLARFSPEQLVNEWLIIGPDEPSDLYQVYIELSKRGDAAFVALRDGLRSPYHHVQAWSARSLGDAFTSISPKLGYPAFVDVMPFLLEALRRSSEQIQRDWIATALFTLFLSNLSLTTSPNPEFGLDPSFTPDLISVITPKIVTDLHAMPDGEGKEQLRAIILIRIFSQVIVPHQSSRWAGRSLLTFSEDFVMKRAEANRCASQLDRLLMPGDT